MLVFDNVNLILHGATDNVLKYNSCFTLGIANFYIEFHFIFFFLPHVALNTLLRKAWWRHAPDDGISRYFFGLVWTSDNSFRRLSCYLKHLFLNRHIAGINVLAVIEFSLFFLWSLHCLNRDFMGPITNERNRESHKSAVLDDTISSMDSTHTYPGYMSFFTALARQ